MNGLPDDHPARTHVPATSSAMAALAPAAKQLPTAEEIQEKQELAEHEFERFVESMDLLINLEKMDAEDRTAFDKAKDRLVREIVRGFLVVNEKGEMIYTPHHPDTKHDKPIHFYERKGSAVMGMDSKKKGHDVAKTYAVMGAMCRVHQSVFADLVGTDGKVCEAIFALLMD